MAEWMNSIPVGIAAYLGGVLTKPLQDWIADKREERKLRKVLYSEIAEAIGRFVNFQIDLRANHDTINYIETTVQYFAKFPCYEIGRAHV